MEYLVLRDCFVDNRLFRKGELRDLPESMNKHPENFQPVNKAFRDKIEVGEIEKALVAPPHIPEGKYWCPEHQKLHSLDTKIGKRCKKKYRL